jgi:hypothetical protein
MQNKKKNKKNEFCMLDGDNTIPHMKLFIWKNGKIILNPKYFKEEQKRLKEKGELND